MDGVLRICALLRADPERWHALSVGSALALPDCWIAAGFVRNAVWDALHGRPCGPITTDVDVIWFDPLRAGAAIDRDIEARLRAQAPALRWSAKNQARMHARNGDAPYASAADAMRHWPETATAIAVRIVGPNRCAISAPYGLDDLWGLRLRPTPAFRGARRAIFQ